MKTLEIIGKILMAQFAILFLILIAFSLWTMVSSQEPFLVGLGVWLISLVLCILGGIILDIYDLW